MLHEVSGSFAEERQMNVKAQDHYTMTRCFLSCDVEVNEVLEL